MNGHIPVIICVCVILLVPAVACASPAELMEGPIVDELREGKEQGEQTFDHEIYHTVLQRHVDLESGTVDYGALSEDRDELGDYLEQLGEASLQQLDADEQLALLLNAYNACTVELILEHYPDIDSIREISSPWDQERCEVGGHTLTLDEIEHEIIRPLYRDPRIHFAVNCAAKDCPPLADFAYRGAEIDEQLRERTEAVLSDEQFVRVESRALAADRLRYTRVMEWYEDDFVNDSFEGHADTVPAYIAEHTQNEQLSEFIENHDGDPPAAPLDYDWSLNDTD